MENLFVSFDLAMLADAEGFNIPCFGRWVWDINDKKYVMLFNAKQLSNSEFPEDITAPTHQQLLDWFREEHRIMIVVDFTIDDGIIDYRVKISEPKTWHEQDIFVKADFPTYYSALNKAFEESFKIIKNYGK